MASRCPRSSQRTLPGKRPGREIGSLLFCLSVFRSRCENLARLLDVSLPTAMSGGSLSRTGACLHASRSRGCFEPAFLFKDVRRKNWAQSILCCQGSASPRLCQVVSEFSGLLQRSKHGVAFALRGKTLHSELSTADVHASLFTGRGRGLFFFFSGLRGVLRLSPLWPAGICTPGSAHGRGPGRRGCCINIENTDR